MMGSTYSLGLDEERGRGEAESGVEEGVERLELENFIWQGL